MTYEIEEISNTDMFVPITKQLYRHKNGGTYFRTGNLFRLYATLSTPALPTNKAYQLITKEEKVLKILKDYERSRL